MLTFIMPFHTCGNAPYCAWWCIGHSGVLFAIGQHDIKRLLAYHSVENIGIILLGLGLGIIGTVYGLPPLPSSALPEVAPRHQPCLFKGLLFLGAGAVIRQTGTGDIDSLGGLIKSMPRTALLFLIGSVAICGLPFFNGFISEIMIYVAGITGAVHAASRSLHGGLRGNYCPRLIGALPPHALPRSSALFFSVSLARKRPAGSTKSLVHVGRNDHPRIPLSTHRHGEPLFLPFSCFLLKCWRDR